MNINLTFKNNSNIENNNEHVNLRSSQTIPFAHPLSPFNKKYEEERPLKTSSQNLSFKGLSVTFDNMSKGVSEYGKIFGRAAEDYFKDAINQAARTSGSGLKVNGESITFTDKNFGEKLIEVLTYPVTNLPLNSANSILTTLQKVPGFKNSKFIKNVLDTELLTKQRIKMENVSNAASIKHYFETLNHGGKEIFGKGHSRFSTEIGNYDSTKERTWTRFATGFFPAILYLPSDANTNVLVATGDKDKAKQEAKIRRNQELIRVGMTVGATFAVLKLFSEFANKSSNSTAFLIAIVTILSEIFGRVAVGNPVLPLSKEGAIKLAKKRGLVKESQSNNSIGESKSDSKNNTETLSDSDNGKKPEKTNKTDKLTVANVLKVLGAMVLAGWVINKKLIKIKKVEEGLSSFKKNYEKLFTKDFIMSREEFNRITQKLRDNGFDKIADKYNEIIKEQKGDAINLGRTDDKVKKLLINDLLTYPVQFSWKLLMMPYKGLDYVCELIKKTIKKTPEINDLPDIKALKKEELKMLKKSIQYLKKIDNRKNYKDYVNYKILDGFNGVTKSKFSNAKSAGKTKNIASVCTGGFLIFTDTPSQIMVNTFGEDKDLAVQKTKERAVQRLFKTIYGAFFVSLFTHATSSIYNTSLLVAELVNICQVLTTETLERKSVGMPINAKTREEILESERKNLSATGLKGKYFRAMAQITGKKPISEQAA